MEMMMMMMMRRRRRRMMRMMCGRVRMRMSGKTGERVYVSFTDLMDSP
jgi:hypothetical protein